MRVLGVLLGLLLSATAAFGLLRVAASRRAPDPGPRSAGPSRDEIDAGIARGVAYLVGSQNPSGSWGSPASNLWDIYAPVPGAYYAFETGVTGLSVSALLAAGGDDPAAAAAARKGTDFLLAKHTRAKRVSEDVLYNVWGHAYALEAFCDVLDRERDAARRAALEKGCAECVDLLRRYEFVDGGWGYYNFNLVVQHPEHGATSFTTASVLVALKKAADHGIAVPKALVRRALDLVLVTRKPDGAFAYSWEHRQFPQGRINKVEGSLARVPACLLALHAWGEPVPTSRFVQALARLDEFGKFLQIARKYPIPHEAWYQNSGYFCFYGYYYATGLLALVPPSVRAAHRAKIARVLLPLQEEDGSWWDYQLYSYHKAYGTSYVLLALARCR